MSCAACDVNQTLITIEEVSSSSITSHMHMHSLCLL